MNLSQTETDSQYVITVNTGDENAKVDINLKGNVLHLSMTRQVQSGSGNTMMQSLQAVSQALQLPDDADPATVNTHREKGKVTVTVDKLASKKEETL
jgi:HSP20 family molecular chaperone IbpA